VTKVKPATRWQVYWRNWLPSRELRCEICGRKVSTLLPRDHPHRATIDHIYPRGQGGSNALDNLQVACRRCNQAKADHYPWF
jgi:5-methylcytosine-specific restriction endonuclease McrA